MSLDFDADTPVVGMVHLSPLPGAPGYDDDNRPAIRDAALRDASRLEAGGVDALLVENFGDAPFYADDVPKHVVASMAALVRDITREAEVPVGVNVLRNDAEAAVSIAAAADADFVRVNVHTGARLTDQGVVDGQAAETVRLRDRLDAAEVSMLADIDVKHSAALAERPLSEGVAELLERGHADGVIASGAGTGHATDHDHLQAVVDARDRLDADAPVFVGSGVTQETVGATLDLADGAIVGTALKQNGETTAPVDVDRVRALVDAAR